MKRDELLKKTIDGLTSLSDPKLQEVHDFVDTLLGQIENRILTDGMHELIANSDSFSFLEEDGVVYQVADLKEKYK